MYVRNTFNNTAVKAAYEYVCSVNFSNSPHRYCGVGEGKRNLLKRLIDLDNTLYTNVSEYYEFMDMIEQLIRDELYGYMDIAECMKWVQFVLYIDCFGEY